MKSKEKFSMNLLFGEKLSDATLRLNSVTDLIFRGFRPLRFITLKHKLLPSIAPASLQLNGGLETWEFIALMLLSLRNSL